MTLDHSSEAAQYERQAESIRHSLANSINELNQRLTPGQIFDEVLSYANGGGGTVLRAFSNAARRNPVPSLLIGTGCMMFLAERMGLGGNGWSERGAGYGRRAYPEGERVYPEHEQPTESGRSKIKETVKHGAEAVGSTLSSATERVREKAHDVRDQVTDALHQAKETAQGVGESLTETASHTRTQVSESARQMKERTINFIGEQPLVAAGIGLAIGAALAAILPATRLEDRLMGETSDSVKKSVGKVAKEQLGAAKAVAGRLAEEAIDVAEREGLTPKGAAAAARDLGDKLAGTADPDPARRISGIDDTT